MSAVGIAPRRDALSEPFAAVLSKDAALQFADSLSVANNSSMVGFFALLTMDRDALIQAIAEVRGDSGDNEAMSIVEAMAGVRENLEAVAALARMVEARSIIAACVVFGEPLPEDDAPQDLWDLTLAAYDVAAAAEQAYYAEHIDRYIPDDLPIGPEREAACALIPPSVWEEADRLCDLRYIPEDILLDMPSPNLAAFARKVIICRDKDRDLNGLDDMLVTEARRLTAEQAS